MVLSCCVAVWCSPNQFLCRADDEPTPCLFGDTLPTIDASDIRTIRRKQDVYEVITGERWGTVLFVSIVAGEVVVRNVGGWIS